MKVSIDFFNFERISDLKIFLNLFLELEMWQFIKVQKVLLVFLELTLAPLLSRIKNVTAPNEALI